MTRPLNLHFPVFEKFGLGAMDQGHKQQQTNTKNRNPLVKFAVVVVVVVAVVVVMVMVMVMVVVVVVVVVVVGCCWLLLLVLETKTAAQHSCHTLQVRDFKGTLLGTGIGSKVWRDVSSWTSCRCGTQVLVGLFLVF